MADRYGIDSGIAAHSLRGLARETRCSLAFLPAVLRKRSIFVFWMRSARRAQAMLASTFVVMLLLFPPVAHLAVQQLYPPKTHRVDPRAAVRESAAVSIGWAIGLISAALLLAVHLPVSVARAGALSRELEREGDEKRALEPG